MSDSGAFLVYTTWPDEKSAAACAKQLVVDRFAACANVMPAGRSFYMWAGELEEAVETVVIFKTTRARFEDLRHAILELHPADCPCIVALKIKDGHKEFLEWVGENSV